MLQSLLSLLQGCNGIRYLIILLLATSGALAQADCQGLLFGQKFATRLLKEYRLAFDHPEAGPDIPAPLRLAQATFAEQNVSFKKVRGGCLTILPGGETPLNRIARRMWTFAGSKLRFCPRELIDGRSLGQFDPETRVLFLDVESVVHGRPSQTFIHEYRHLYCETVAGREGNSCLLNDQISGASGGLIPGFADDPDSGYSEVFQLDEISTYTHDVLLEIRKLQNAVAIKEIGRLRQSIVDHVALIDKFQRVAHLNLQLALDVLYTNKTGPTLVQIEVPKGQIKRYGLVIKTRTRTGEQASVLLRFPVGIEPEMISFSQLRSAARERLQAQLSFLSELDVPLDYAVELTKNLPQKNYRDFIGKLQDVMNKVEEQCHRALVNRGD